MKAICNLECNFINHGHNNAASVMTTTNTNINNPEGFNNNSCRRNR